MTVDGDITDARLVQRNACHHQMHMAVIRDKRNCVWRDQESVSGLWLKWVLADTRLPAAARLSWE
jgi:hypothetical protein